MYTKEKELAILRQRQNSLRREHLIKDSKNHLKKIANKKFRTCFIAALAEFENTFGLIWGHNLSEEQLTSDQKINKKKWGNVRKNILDKGNTQARALGMEIDLYEIEFKGYQINFRGRNSGQ